MNKNNILNREYITNEYVLKKAPSKNHSTNLYSSFFNLDKKTAPSINFNIKHKKNTNK